MALVRDLVLPTGLAQEESGRKLYSGCGSNPCRRALRDRARQNHARHAGSIIHYQCPLSMSTINVHYQCPLSMSSGVGALGPIWGGSSGRPKADIMEAEGRLNGGLGAKPPGNWGPWALWAHKFGPIWQFFLTVYGPSLFKTQFFCQIPPGALGWFGWFHAGLKKV